MMQPHVFRRLLDGDEVRASSPSTLGGPISSATARQVTEMMVTATREGMGGRADLPGYTVAGAAGTAQVPTTLGYEAGTSIVSFIGFLPADDRGSSFSSGWTIPTNTGARRPRRRLPAPGGTPGHSDEHSSDDVRRDLVAAGGAVEAIQH